MVNISTNMKKKNNPLSPQIIERKNTTTYHVRNSDPGLGQAQTCGEFKQLNGTPTLLLDNCISDDNTDTCITK